MKLAYLIAAHAYPRLLARVVRRLQSPVSSIFVHIDRKVDIRPFKIEGVQRVQWVRRVRSGWGSSGQVDASLSLLLAALEHDSQADRFILLSGQDYPLMNPGGMAAFFQERPDADFLTFHRLPWAAWTGSGGLDRLRRFHFSSFVYPSDSIPGSRLVRAAYKACELFLPKERPLPDNITLYGGSNWWNLTRRSAEAILDFVQSNPAFVRRFRYTKSADEIFFQTVLLNLPAPPRLENDDLRCVFWDGGRNEMPAILRIEDFPEIAASGKLFARKMHPQTSVPLLDRIDDELLG